MNVDLRYWGRSDVSATGGGVALRLQPNLARPAVHFDAEVARPVRFREAMSALHQVVVGDLKWKKKDKAAYQAWLASERDAESALRRSSFAAAKQAALAETVGGMPPGLDDEFHKWHRRYWRARNTWLNELARADPALWRHLVPYDPVITVAPDVVFFECFSKDESSYGCLTVERGAFRDERGATPGTTNVDYSLDLYEHFQTLRSYRPTRLVLDPAGFSVQVSGRAELREEKIDLPPSWLRGFGQIQAAMTLPCRTVELSVEQVYAILAWLKGHREKAGPRSLRFQLTPGQPPTVVIEPWGVPVVSRGRAWAGERAEEIKVWGRRRLMALHRVLPLAHKVEVQLLGSGLPSVWIAHLGEMRFVLALSGWTTNDWTAGASLELLADGYRADAATVAAVERYLAAQPAASLAVLARAVGAPKDKLLGSLHQLARQGQLIYDYAVDKYRYRQVMPAALSAALVGPESPELVHGRRLAGAVKLDHDEATADGRRLWAAKVEGTTVEALVDSDLRFTRARCTCSFFHKSGLRAGPCRHLIALRLAVQARAGVS